MGFDMRTKQQFLLILGFAVSVFSAPASAAIQWTLNTGLSCSGGANFGNYCQKTTGGVQVNAKAYSPIAGTAKGKVAASLHPMPFPFQLMSTCDIASPRFTLSAVKRW